MKNDVFEILFFTKLRLFMLFLFVHFPLQGQAKKERGFEFFTLLLYNTGTDLNCIHIEVKNKNIDTESVYSC